MRDQILNLTQPDQKVKLINAIRAMRGVVRVSIVGYRGRRSDRQNRYYWPCFVHPFWEYLHGQGCEYSEETCHGLLKAKFLKREVPNPVTGEVMEFIPSTSSLDTAEFNEYLDKCAHWLSDMFGIQIPEPSVYREPIDPKEKKAA